MERYGRKVNLAAGRCHLPLGVLQEAGDEFYSVRGYGTSVAELCDRTPIFEALQDALKRDYAALTGLDRAPFAQAFHLFCVSAGPAQQHASLPLNLLHATSCVHLLTGPTSTAAHREASKFVRASAAPAVRLCQREGMLALPPSSERPRAQYLHCVMDEPGSGFAVSAE